jgi:large subunit ribosomal protein L18
VKPDKLRTVELRRLPFTIHRSPFTPKDKNMASSNDTARRRADRVRRQLKKVAGDRPRLSVHRSSKHIYAQVIDDAKGCTLAAASTLEGDLKGSLKTGADTAAATAVGKLIAERAVRAGVKEVIFDRGRYIYHGRVKALAEAAREGGLSF